MLAFGVQETIEALPEAEDAAVIGALRREGNDGEGFALSLGELYARGAQVEWDALHPGAEPVPLPTYPFQRERYWVQSVAGAANVGAAGLGVPEHPLLGAEVPLAGEESWLFTGRISPEGHPWLADHAVSGPCCCPATGFAELALKAGSEVGCDVVEELTLQAPLVFPEQGAVQLQINVGEPDENGRRALAIHSRPTESAEEEAGEWTRHAAGLLAPAPPALDERLERLVDSDWPPEGAEQVAIDSLYERLAELGWNFDLAFQCLRRAWQRGDEIFAEVSLGEQLAEEAGRYGIHPVLFDAAFHAGLNARFETQERPAVRIPFSWSGLRLHRHGASSLRISLTEDENGAATLMALDEAGAPVLTMPSLVVREVSEAQLAAARPHADSLFALEWVAAPAAEAQAGPVAVLGSSERIDADALGATPYADLDALAEAIDGGVPPPEVVLAAAPASGEAEIAAAHEISAEALSLLQRWLAAPQLADSRLAVLTEEALAAREGESPNLAQAPLAGLLRSAHSENPGRFALIDADASEASRQALPAALALAEEPQLALREGELLCARLARARAPEEPDEEQQAPLDLERTVLITGATGGLGALVARHLAEAHGARHLLLLSRSGIEAKGAEELQAELKEAGAEATIVACDVSDRDALAEAIAQIPEEHPLGAIVHAAGVLDDGVLDSLDRERLDRVFVPKLDAAWHLHELSREHGLSRFVLFSSQAGVFGNPGQANYAAANSFCDALAAHRQAQGLPATSLAWGLWEQASGMAGDSSEAGFEIVKRQVHAMGMLPLSAAQGLGLLDTTLTMDEPLLGPMRLDFGVLRRQAADGVLPALMRGLVRAPARSTSEGSLAKRLAEVGEAEREAVVLELVRGHVAAVLGHASGEAVEPERAFKEMGFDSLGAVELRNRLSRAAGLRLPSTLVFDHPNPAAVAELLAREVDVDGASSSSLEDGIGRVESMLSALAGDERSKDRVEDRLRLLRQRLDAFLDGHEGEDGEEDLESASDEQIFELLDKEFESS